MLSWHSRAHDASNARLRALKSAHAVLGYGAVHFGRAHVDRGLLIKAFASYTLVNAVVNLVTRRGFGEKVRNAAP